MYQHPVFDRALMGAALSFAGTIGAAIASSLFCLPSLSGICASAMIVVAACPIAARRRRKRAARCQHLRVVHAAGIAVGIQAVHCSCCSSFPCRGSGFCRGCHIDRHVGRAASGKSSGGLNSALRRANSFAFQIFHYVFSERLAFT